MGFVFFGVNTKTWLALLSLYMFYTLFDKEYTSFQEDETAAEASRNRNRLTFELIGGEDEDLQKGEPVAKPTGDMNSYQNEITKYELIGGEDEDLQKGEPVAKPTGDMNSYQNEISKYPAMSRREVKDFLNDIRVYAVVDFAGRPSPIEDRKCYFFLDPTVAVSYLDEVGRRSKDFIHSVINGIYSVREFSLGNVWFKYSLDGAGIIMYGSTRIECRLVPDYYDYTYAKSLMKVKPTRMIKNRFFSSTRVLLGKIVANLSLVIGESLPAGGNPLKINVKPSKFIEDLDSVPIFADLAGSFPMSYQDQNLSFSSTKKTIALHHLVEEMQKEGGIDFRTSTIIPSSRNAKAYKQMLGKYRFNPERSVTIEMERIHAIIRFYLTGCLFWALSCSMILLAFTFIAKPISRRVKRFMARLTKKHNEKSTPRPPPDNNNWLALPDRVQGPVMDASNRDFIERVTGWLLLPITLPLLISLTFLTYPLSVISDTPLYLMEREFHKLFIVWFSVLQVPFYLICTANNSDFVITPYTLYLGFLELILQLITGTLRYNKFAVLVMAWLYALPSFAEFCALYMGIKSPNYVYYIWKPIFCSLSFWGLIWDTFCPILDDKDISKYEPEQYKPITPLVFTRQQKREMFSGWGNLKYVFNPKLEYKYVFEPDWGNPVLFWFFSRLPLNHGTNFKLYLLAKHYRVEEIQRVVELPENNEGESKRKHRMESLKMLRLQDRPFSLIPKDEEGTLKALKHVSANGADLNFPNSLGQTMLHDMCRRGYSKCIEWLLHKGADPNSRDIEGCTPLQYLVAGYSCDSIPAIFVQTRKHFDRERRRAIDLILDYEPPALSDKPVLDYEPPALSDKPNSSNEMHSLLRDSVSRKSSFPTECNQPSSVDLSILSSCDYIEGGASAYMMFHDRFQMFPMNRFFFSLLCCYFFGNVFWTMLLDPFFEGLLELGPRRLNTTSESLEALRPKPSWRDLERILILRLPIEDTCGEIYDLIARSNKSRSRTLHRLRLRDMLFCRNEGDRHELKRRQEVVFNYFLEPALNRSAKEPMISDSFKKMLEHFFHQSEDPRDKSRPASQDKFDKLIKGCNDAVNAFYQEELDRLVALSEKDPKSYENKLLCVEKTSTNPHLCKGHLSHELFMKAPDWAIRSDLAGAICGLHQVGVIDSVEMFCELIQQGRNPLLPTPNPQIFHKGPSSPDFWIALVLLWSIGIQMKINDGFNNKMREVNPEAFIEAPGVKKFPRSFEKALEYMEEKCLGQWEEKVCAGLHVIDGLRCTFVVETAEENITLGRRLEERFPVIRTKNSHRRDIRKYADRKYNVLYRTAVEGIGEVAFMCEVKIIMKRYVEISDFEHLFYEFRRSKETIMPSSSILPSQFYGFFVICTSFPFLVGVYNSIFYREVALNCDPFGWLYRMCVHVGYMYGILFLVCIELVIADWFLKIECVEWVGWMAKIIFGSDGTMRRLTTGCFTFLFRSFFAAAAVAIVVLFIPVTFFFTIVTTTFFFTIVTPKISEL